LKKLRQEAFADLQLQLQHYNDEFISRMRYIENNRGHLAASPSTESLCSTSSTSSSTSTSSSSDDSVIMHDLVELFEAGTVKDYTPLIEWELCRVRCTDANKIYVSLTNTYRIRLLISKAKVNMVTFGEKKKSLFISFF
jgi:hypothetical protein